MKQVIVEENAPAVVGEVIRVKNEIEWDEFYGRCRETEVDIFLSDTVKSIALTLPDKERTAIEDYGCHVVSSCYDLARNLLALMILSPRDKYEVILEETMKKLSNALYEEASSDNQPRHPDLDFDKDFDTIELLIKGFSRRV